ncbi:MAG: acetate kinase, partial [Candidatus Poribacteria bacterium]|nr:acetate kinase [Candidatus Poribacteria bacterium]
VAVLETGFHQSIPDYAYDFGVPRSWMEKHRIRRYGFHGASHRWVSERVPEILNRPSKDLKIISCHLGGSSSLAAIREGKSIDTSMGVSTQYGVLQSTRVGDLDPFAALYVMAQEGWSPTEITRQLMEDSGLKGISGISGDMRDLEAAADSGNDRARLAIQAYCYGVKKYIGAYTAALGSVDVLAYTGGIGEKSITARSAICDGLSWMGIELNPDKNRQNKPETLISSTDSRVKILIIPANEEFIVARETARLLSK